MTNLFTIILNMSITASYVIIAVIAIRIILKKVPRIFSYVLWLPVLIRLVFPFSFNTDFSFFSLLKPIAQTNTGAMEHVPNNIGFMQNPIVDVGISRINNAVSASLPTAAPYASVNPVQILIEFANIIWVVGIVILLFYSIISYIKVINNVKTATLVKDNIFETDRITNPFVCGFIRPKIFIPVGISDDELSYILTHEQTHIKRLDYLIKPFAFLVLVVHWFNPLIWLSFALMSKDMEMSCDESVLKKMGDEIKGSYSNSLLSLSVKRNGLLKGSPLAFGESNIKSRIKNVLTYKKPAIWLIIITILVTSALMVAFTANPKSEQIPESTTTYKAYDIDTLIANKTPYIGDNSKVIALINAMPLPDGIVRDKVELLTSKKPYGITIYLIMNDDSGVTVQGGLMGNACYPNAMLLFSLIDNVDSIEYKILDNTGKHERAWFPFTYTRETADKQMGADIRTYAGSTFTLKKLIDRLNSIETMIVPTATGDQIEKYIDTIMSSPNTSSSPQDYIKAHPIEYESILKMGDIALKYLLDQFEKHSINNDLRGNIVMLLCKELLGDRNNVTDDSLPPQEWFSQFSPYKE